MIGSIPIGRKNWLTLGGDPIADTDSRSLFDFPLPLPLRNKALQEISYTFTGHFRNSAKWRTPADDRMNPLLGAIQVKSGSGWIWKSGFEYSNTGSLVAELLAKWLALADVGLLRTHLVSHVPLAFYFVFNVAAHKWRDIPLIPFPISILPSRK